MTRLRILLALIAAVGLAGAPVAHAATPNHRLGTPELRVNATGPDVAAMQWMLSGHRPYALSKIKPTLKTYDKGISGPASSRTWKAVRDMKFRLGYPGGGQCTAKTIVPAGVHWNSNSAGPYFFALLLGHKQRPACWVALSAKRIARAEAGATAAAMQLAAFELRQIGTQETGCSTCNIGTTKGPGGYSVNDFEAYFSLRGLQWCAIFQGFSMRHVGLPLLAASNPFYVPDIITWGRYHGYLRAAAKVGEFVLYYGDISHIGYVIAVSPKTGQYLTVEGNWNNQVAHVMHPAFDHLHYFLAVPRLAR